MTDFPFNRCAILGTGLIGGSLAGALRQHAPGCTVVGFDRPHVLERAEERDLIDEKAASMGAAVDGADLVVLAFSPAKIASAMEPLAPHLSSGAVVTDVASVKQAVVDQARSTLPDHVAFVGGHPMAGAETAGIDAADPILFENAAYVLTPTDSTPDDTLNDLYAVVEATGATPVTLTPEAHDRIVARVSHLPQLLAVTLMQHAAASDDDALALAAGGFRDLTRIAESPFELWREIFAGNQGSILDALADFTRRLQRVQRQVATEDMNALEEDFTAAQDARARLPEEAAGLIRSVHDCTVRVPDEAGALYAISKPLAEANVSVRNIELLRVRDGTGGTFRLSFRSREALHTALDALSTVGFDVQAG
jgi:prephenate dehydrogenase